MYRVDKQQGPLSLSGTGFRTLGETRMEENIKQNTHYVGFPGGASGKEPAGQGRRQEMWVQSMGQEDPLEKALAFSPVFLPGEFHALRSLAGCSP